MTEIPVFDQAKDGMMRMNLPCLSHLSFKLYHGQVHLTALYRSHDYRFKAFGNLLGLSRLQSCVANEVDAEAGTLVIHSSRAFIQQGVASSRDFKDIVEGLD
jgi:thymidylate synthase